MSNRPSLPARFDVLPKSILSASVYFSDYEDLQSKLLASVLSSENFSRKQMQKVNRGIILKIFDGIDSASFAPRYKQQMLVRTHVCEKSVEPDHQLFL